MSNVFQSEPFDKPTASRFRPYFAVPIEAYLVRNAENDDRGAEIEEVGLCETWENDKNGRTDEYVSARRAFEDFPAEKERLAEELRKAGFYWWIRAAQLLNVAAASPQGIQALDVVTLTVSEARDRFRWFLHDVNEEQVEIDQFEALLFCLRSVPGGAGAEIQNELQKLRHPLIQSKPAAPKRRRRVGDDGEDGVIVQVATPAFVLAHIRGQIQDKIRPLEPLATRFHEGGEILEQALKLARGRLLDPHGLRAANRPETRKEIVSWR